MSGLSWKTAEKDLITFVRNPCKSMKFLLIMFDATRIRDDKGILTRAK